MGRNNHFQIFKLSRASGIELNPTQFAQRSTTFAETALGPGQTATLVIYRSENGLDDYLVLDGNPQPDQAALLLAQTLGAHKEPVDELPDLVTGSKVVELLADAKDTGGRYSQVGADPMEISRLVASLIDVDSWVAITLRSITRTERRRWKPYILHRLDAAVATHHTLNKSVVVFSALAGTGNYRDSSAMLGSVMASLPGLDMPTKTRRVNPTAAKIGTVVLAFALALLSWFTPDILGRIPYDFSFDVPSRPALATTGFIVPALVAIGLITGVVKSRAGMMIHRLKSDRFTPAAKRVIPPARPRKADPQNDKDAAPGDYPLAQTGIIAAPEVILGLAAPQAGAVSGEASTTSRSIPLTLTERIGPMIGYGMSSDERCYLPAVEQTYGVAVIGRSGSGKSQLVRSMFGFAELERLCPTGFDGWPGERDTLIAIEYKGNEGAAEFMHWADATGDTTTLIEVADRAIPAIDFFAVPGRAGDKAKFFVNAMQYSFNDGEIQGRSQTSLTRLITGALAVTGEVVDEANADLQSGDRPISRDLSAVSYAHILAGGYGDSLGVRLHAAIKSTAERRAADGNPDADLDEARDALANLYEGKTEAARRSLIEASENKLEKLASLEDWFTPARVKMTWSDILTEHRAVVINTGQAIDGTLIEDSSTKLISAMLMYSLQAAIRRECSGWQAQGRSVSVFADELSLLCGSSPDTVTWFRNQGRSYGVRVFFATQYPKQLGQEVREAFMSFSTLIAFAQDSGTIAAEIAEDFSADGSAWSSADFVNLPRYSAAIRTNLNQQRQSAFTARIEHFEADRPAYADRQGYAPAPVEAAT